MECPICLEAFTEQTAVCPPCGHLFHKECIDRHVQVRVRASASCPSCRSTFDPAERAPAHLPAQYRGFWQPGLRKVFLGADNASQHATDDFRARFQALEDRYRESQTEVERCRASCASMRAYSTRLTGSLQAVAQERDAAVREHGRCRDGLAAAGAQLQEERTAHQATQQELRDARAALAQRQDDGRAAVDRLGTLLGQWRETRLTGLPPVDANAGELQAALDAERELHDATKRALEEQTCAVGAKETALQARESRVEELQRLLLEKDQQLVAKENALMAKSSRLAAKDGQLAAKTSQIAEMENQLVAKDRQIAEKMNVIATKDGLIQEREQQRNELYRQLTRKDRQLEENARQILEQTSQIEAREIELLETDDQLDDKDEQLEQQETEIATKRRELAIKDRLLAEKDQYIVDLRTKLAEIEDRHRGTSGQRESRLPAVDFTFTAQALDTQPARPPYESNTSRVVAPLSPPATPRRSPELPATGPSTPPPTNRVLEPLTPVSAPRRAPAAGVLPRVYVASNRLPGAPVATIVRPCRKNISGQHAWRTTGSNQYIRKFNCRSCGCFVEETKSSWGADGYWIPSLKTDFLED